MTGWALFLLAVGGGGLLGLAVRTHKASLVLIGLLLIMVGGIGFKDIGAARATTCLPRLSRSCAPVPSHAAIARTRRVPTRRSSVPIPSEIANPVYQADFPDPFVLPSGNGYYAYATNTWVANIPVMYSRDLVHWSSRGDALPELPSWAEQGKLRTWAPSVIRIGAVYRMYVTVGDRAHQIECIGVASSVTPTGPFRLEASGPLLCGQSGAIDASPFRAADGTLWLDWKYERAGSGTPQIMAEQLAADGRTLTGSPATLLTPSLYWEHGVVEGPSMLHRDGQYLLFYAAADWQTTAYATGLAHCASPIGPCTKEPQPFLASSTNTVGPGGLTLFTAGDGGVYAAFHSWHDGAGYAAGGVRSLNIRQLTPALLTRRDG
jgi:beta-xylosidase